MDIDPKEADSRKIEAEKRRSREAIRAFFKKSRRVPLLTDFVSAQPFQLDGSTEYYVLPRVRNLIKIYGGYTRSASVRRALEDAGIIPKTVETESQTPRKQPEPKPEPKPEAKQEQPPPPRPAPTPKPAPAPAPPAAPLSVSPPTPPAKPKSLRRKDPPLKVPAPKKPETTEVQPLKPKAGWGIPIEKPVVAPTSETPDS